MPATRAVIVGATESTNTVEGRSQTVRPARLVAETCQMWRPWSRGAEGTKAVACVPPTAVPSTLTM